MNGVLYRAFADICNGYSTCKINGVESFIKHMSFRDRLDIDIIQEREFTNAVSQGLPDEKSRLIELKKEGSWTDENERELAQQVYMVKSMIDGKKTIGIPSLLARHIENIKVEEKKLQDMRDKKAQLMGLTAEGFAQKVVNDHYLYTSFYKDVNLSARFWEFEDFDNLDEDEVEEIAKVYDLSLNKVCSEKNIKLLCIQGFFQSYFVLCDSDVSEFFGKPITQMTFFQTQLGNNALYFKYLYENNDVASLPDHVKADPDLMISYLDSIKKGKADVAKLKDGNTSVIGATKEDREALGIKEGRGELPNRRLDMAYFAAQK